MLGCALPLAQYLPGAQSTQLSCPALGWEVPAGHGRHGRLESVVKLPAWHVVTVVELSGQYLWSSGKPEPARVE